LDLQEVFFSKTNPILTGKPCASAAASIIDAFLCRDICVSCT
jgi:hypothetical protein